jgi:hypothetical protein
MDEQAERNKKEKGGERERQACKIEVIEHEHGRLDMRSSFIAHYSK